MRQPLVSLSNDDAVATPSCHSWRGVAIPRARGVVRPTTSSLFASDGKKFEAKADLKLSPRQRDTENDVCESSLISEQRPGIAKADCFSPSHFSDSLHRQAARDFRRIPKIVRTGGSIGSQRGHSRNWKSPKGNNLQKIPEKMIAGLMQEHNFPFL